MDSSLKILPFSISYFLLLCQKSGVCRCVDNMGHQFGSIDPPVCSYANTGGCFQYCSSVVEFGVRDCDASEVLLLYRIVLAILGLLLFHMKLSTVLLRSLRNFAGILMSIALNL